MFRFQSTDVIESLNSKAFTRTLLCKINSYNNWRHSRQSEIMFVLWALDSVWCYGRSFVCMSGFCCHRPNPVTFSPQIFQCVCVLYKNSCRFTLNLFHLSPFHHTYSCRAHMLFLPIQRQFKSDWHQIFNYYWFPHFSESSILFIYFFGQ